MTFLLLVTSIPSVRLSHIHCTHKKIHVLNRNKDNKSETRDRVDWSHRGWNLRLNENTLCQCNYSTLEITAAPINSSWTIGHFHFWRSILIFIDLCLHQTFILQKYVLKTCAKICTRTGSIWTVHKEQGTFESSEWFLIDLKWPSGLI